MNKTILAFFTAFIILTGCSKEALTVQVIRNPVISFDTDSVSWRADNYFFTGPARAVVFLPNSPTGALYNRFTLQAAGKDTRGNNLQLNIVFDAVDSNRLSGFYRPSYNPERGLQETRLYNIGSTLSAYSLCIRDTANAVLRVQKQSISERLITGTFEMTVCNIQDTTQKIRIRNGVITDIRY
jgi:hypothetical protein